MFYGNASNTCLILATPPPPLQYILHSMRHSDFDLSEGGQAEIRWLIRTCINIESLIFQMLALSQYTVCFEGTQGAKQSQL